MSDLVSRNYSNALFELAKEQNILDDVRKQLKIVVDTLNANEDLFKTIDHPSIEKKDKKEIILKIFTDANNLLKNFMQLLIDKNRFCLINSIYDIYCKEYRKEKGIVIAYVKTAKQLSEEELEKIKDILEKKNNKTVELKMKVDNSLIAGIRIEINDEVIDNTVLNRFNSLKEEINKQSI